MISLEGHTKHIKLMSQYISTLEKQLQAKNKEIQTLSLIANNSLVKESSNILDDYRRFKTQNTQQTEEIDQLKLDTKRLKAIEVQKAELQKQILVERDQRTKLYSKMNQLKLINRKLYELTFKQNSTKITSFDHENFNKMHQNEGLRMSRSSASKQSLSDSRRLNEEVLQMMNKITYLQEINIKKHQENDKLRAIIGQLEKNKVVISVLEQKLKESQGINRQLQAQMTAITIQKDRQYQEFRMNHTNQEKKSKNYQILIEQCRSQLNKYKQELTVLKDSQAKVKKQMHSLRRNNEGLNEQNIGLQIEMRKIEESHQQERLSLLKEQEKSNSFETEDKQKLKVFETQNEKLKQNQRERTRLIEEFQIRIDNSNKTIENQKSQIKYLQQRSRWTQQLQQQIQNLQFTHQQQTKKRITKQQQLQTLNKNYQNLQKTIQQTTKTLIKQKQDEQNFNKKQTNQQKSYLETIAQLNDRIAHLEKQNFILEQSYDKIRLTYMLESKRNLQNESFIQKLNKNMQNFNKSVEGRINDNLSQINKSLAEKDNVIRRLKESNSVLRKQMIDHLKVEEQQGQRNQQQKIMNSRSSKSKGSNQKLYSSTSFKSSYHDELFKNNQKNQENLHQTQVTSQQNSFDISKPQQIRSTPKIKQSFSILQNSISENEIVQYEINF